MGEPYNRIDYLSLLSLNHPLEGQVTGSQRFEESLLGNLKFNVEQNKGNRSMKIPIPCTPGGGT